MRGKAVLTLTALLCAFSESACADDPASKTGAPRSAAVRLTDGELDRVYAGALSIVLMENPGNEDVFHLPGRGNHVGCINATECGLQATDTGVRALHIVIPPNKPPMFHVVGGGAL